MCPPNALGNSCQDFTKGITVRDYIPQSKARHWQKKTIACRLATSTSTFLSYTSLLWANVSMHISPNFTHNALPKRHEYLDREDFAFVFT
jgi:hypothetical protein